MLIETKVYETGDIIALKTIGGEEVVAQVEREFSIGDSNDILVSRPMILVPSPKGVAMMPYLISINMVIGMNEKIQLSRPTIITIFTPIKDVKNAYIESRSGLKITTPSAGIITHE